MNGSHLALPAMRLGEIVLATGNYEVMKAWYRVMLDLEPSLEHAPTDESATRSGSGPPKPTRMCFFRLHAEHPYQDVIALFEMPGAGCCRRTLGPAPHAASQRLDARAAGAISALASSSALCRFKQWTTARARACTTAIPTRTRSRSPPATSRPTRKWRLALLRKTTGAIRQARSSIPRNGLDSRGSRPTHLEPLRHSAWSGGGHRRRKSTSLLDGTAARAGLWDVRCWHLADLHNVPREVRSGHQSGHPQQDPASFISNPRNPDYTRAFHDGWC